MAAPLADLRAGQLAILRATGVGTLSATALAVRHEVIGPVEQVASDGVLVVAGQRVVTARNARLPAELAPGQWVAVSGLRRADAIVASRIDARPLGGVVVHGRLERDGTGPRIGDLRLVGAGAQTLPPAGSMVVVTGAYAPGDTLRLDTIALDALATDPGRFFPPAVRFVAIETFASGEGGRLRTGAGWAVPTGLTVAPGTPGIVSLQRGGTGLRAVGVAPLPGPAAGIGRPALLPAPLPAPRAGAQLNAPDMEPGHIGGNGAGPSPFVPSGLTGGGPAGGAFPGRGPGGPPGR